MASNNTTKTRLILGVTGSVAAVKAPEIALRLVVEHGLAVKILLTKAGRNFWDQSPIYNSEIWQKFQTCLQDESKKDSPSLAIIDPSDEWRQWKTMGDPVMHIDLRNWADFMLVVPLSAHTLAKFCHGFCDDVLSSVVRAWDFDKKPLLLAPAMNTAMWEHVLTRQQLTTIQNFASNPDRVVVVDPVAKMLACGDYGKGALAPVDDILDAVQSTVVKLLK